jgi:hypothetical protein
MGGMKANRKVYEYIIVHDIMRLIRKVWKKNATNQLVVTIPNDSGIKKEIM